MENDARTREKHTFYVECCPDRHREAEMTIPWQRIQNREQLLSNGSVALRTHTVDIIEHAIRAADPYTATKKLIKLEDDAIHLNGKKYVLEGVKIYVIGAGKASQSIALALEEILGDRISEGIIALKKGEKPLLTKIKIIESSHPVPDENSFLAAKRIIEVSNKATENDIVFAVFTGGSSSLAVYPAEGICLDEKQAVNRLLLKCGASIREINAVRKHISKIKGGKLAAEIFPARLINLTVSDVIGDPLDYITGLTVPDTSTWEDAWNTMDRYHLWDQVPTFISQFMREKRGGETPKKFDSWYQSCILVPGDAAFFGAIKRCEELGYSTEVTEFHIEGESCNRAFEFVALADKIMDQHPLGTRCAFIGRGETTVLLENELGVGGPNQEFALCAAISIQGRKDIVVAAIGTDGTDGPTEASGGIVDGFSIDRAKSKGIVPDESLQSHDSSRFLKQSRDLIITGPTGTNVNDLMIVLSVK